MPIHLTWSIPILYKKYEGFCTGRELLQSVLDVQRDPRFDQLTHSIHDFSQVTGFDVTGDALEITAANTIGATLSNRRLAVAYVATDPKVLGAIEAFHHAFGEVIAAVTFPTLAQAMNWASERRV